MKKILYLLLTTKTYVDRQDNILNSWGKDKELFFYSENEDSVRNVIKVCDENNVEIKQVSIFETIRKNFHNKYDWFFFGDDDTFVNTLFLEKELPSGGAGFLINNKIIHNFFDSKNYNVGAGDVTFGLNMREKNIEIENNELFSTQHYTYYGLDINSVYKYITFHYVKDFNDSLLMDNICKNKLI
jgi:hypothetical protein